VKSPTRIAIIGMGGFAGVHHGAVARLEERGHARLVCTCDPHLERFAGEQDVWRFPARGVQVYRDYHAMLAAHHRDLDLVVVPTPIQLHAEMHAAVAALGLPCYLEKPPTLDPVELEQMIATDALLPKASLVGFNFIIEKPRLALKERLLAGEFGAVRGATLAAQWPRPASYFSRNAWAGRLLADGRIVLDSCFGNAMAHFVHNLLFWAGAPGLHSWAQLAAVRAELYRAHTIEGADTFFVETDTTALTNQLAVGTVLRVPINHFEGNYVCDAATLERLRADDRVVARYVDNPNGSLDDIAGICNESRNIVGLMPHPERASDALLGSADGVPLLESLLHAAGVRAGRHAA